MAPITISATTGLASVDIKFLPLKLSGTVGPMAAGVKDVTLTGMAAADVAAAAIVCSPNDPTNADPTTLSYAALIAGRLADKFTISAVKAAFAAVGGGTDALVDWVAFF